VEGEGRGTVTGEATGRGTEIGDVIGSGIDAVALEGTEEGTEEGMIEGTEEGKVDGGALMEGVDTDEGAVGRAAVGAVALIGGYSAPGIMSTELST
jgi:hypothetical protein